jgi:hypothetical protein
METRSQFLQHEFAPMGKFLALGMNLTLGVNFEPYVGVNTLYSSDEGMGEQKVFTPRGQLLSWGPTSPLGVKFFS